MVQRPRIILLTQLFDPEPALKGVAFAKALIDDGFDVEVVTAFPNYPGGKIYPGYRLRLFQREQMNGVPVTRLWLYPSHDRNPVKRAFTYISFFCACLFYLLFGVKRTDIVYAYSPPITVALAAAISGLFRRTKLVLDVQDMWPDTLAATGMATNSLLIRIIGRISLWLYTRCAHICVLSPGFKALLEKRGVPPEKVSVIFNWADEGADVVQPAWSQPSPAFQVLFAGNVGPAQAMDSVLDAAKIVASQDIAVRFAILGSGVSLEGLRNRCSQENITNVDFLPRVPASEVGEFLAKADCLLVHLSADPLFSITIPSKTQSYLRAGKPIIMAVAGDAADLITTAQAGRVARPQDPTSLADAVLDMAAKSSEDRQGMGERGKAFYQNELSFRAGKGKFLQVFRSLLPSEQGR